MSRILPEECEKATRNFSQDGRSSDRDSKRVPLKYKKKNLKRYLLSRETREWEVKHDGYAVRTDCRILQQHGF